MSSYHHTFLRAWKGHFGPNPCRKDASLLLVWNQVVDEWMVFRTWCFWNHWKWFATDGTIDIRLGSIWDIVALECIFVLWFVTIVVIFGLGELGTIIMCPWILRIAQCLPFFFCIVCVVYSRKCLMGYNNMEIRFFWRDGNIDACILRCCWYKLVLTSTVVLSPFLLCSPLSLGICLRLLRKLMCFTWRPCVVSCNRMCL